MQWHPLGAGRQAADRRQHRGRTRPPHSPQRRHAGTKQTTVGSPRTGALAAARLGQGVLLVRRLPRAAGVHWNGPKGGASTNGQETDGGAGEWYAPAAHQISQSYSPGAPRPLTCGVGQRLPAARGQLPGALRPRRHGPVEAQPVQPRPRHLPLGWGRKRVVQGADATCRSLTLGRRGALGPTLPLPFPYTPMGESRSLSQATNDATACDRHAQGGGARGHECTIRHATVGMPQRWWLSSGAGAWRRVRPAGGTSRRGVLQLGGRATLLAHATSPHHCPRRGLAALSPGRCRPGCVAAPCACPSG